MSLRVVGIQLRLPRMPGDKPSPSLPPARSREPSPRVLEARRSRESSPRPDPRIRGASPQTGVRVCQDLSRSDVRFSRESSPRPEVRVSRDVPPSDARRREPSPQDMRRREDSREQRRFGTPGAMAAEQAEGRKRGGLLPCAQEEKV